MDLHQIKLTLSDLPLGPIRYLNSVGSTNDEASDWANQQAPDLSLVVADEQTAGKGRHGAVWLTPPGAALAFSLVLRDFKLADFGGDPGRLLVRLTALGALGICEALQASYDLQAEIKWPNDVLLGRRKTAGILAEAHWQGDELTAVVLGLGINVAFESVPPGDWAAFPATCIQQALGRPVDRIEMLHSVLSEIIAWRSRLASPAFIQAWDRYLAFKGEWVTVLQEAYPRPPLSRPGLVIGLDQQGHLRLEDQAGLEFELLTGELSLRPVES